MTTKAVQVEGVDSVIRKLRAFDKKVGKKIIRKATRAGGAVELKAVKRIMPKVNRGLQKSMVQKIKTYPASSTVVAIIGQDMGKVKGRGTNKRKRFKGGGISGRGDTVPSHLLENPTKPHAITRRGDQINRWFTSSGPQFAWGSGINHPGTQGGNYIRRAEQSARAATKRAVETKLIIELARAADTIKAMK